MGGTANEWFGSYLENRRQFVVVNGTPSGCSTISCGVPQGSILGPLLFILYINDLNTISKKLRTIMFADDTNLFMTGKNLDEIKIQLNEELKIFSLWFQAMSSYSVPDLSSPPPPTLCKQTPNHPHSYAPDVQTISIFHASPHQQHN